MKLSHFFIDHPRFAAVVSIFIMVFGIAAAAFLPVAQYPNIVPPTVQITSAYPGASAAGGPAPGRAGQEDHSGPAPGCPSVFTGWVSQCRVHLELLHSSCQ